MSLVRPLSRWWDFRDRKKVTRAPAPARPRYRPALEGLEGRLVLSGAGLPSPPALAPALVGPAAHQVSSLLPLSITGVAAQNGQLVARGLLGSIPFTAPLTLGTAPSADPTCPILNLMVGPIHLNVLGLKVDTSALCLSITARSGSGNLLGNLLCDVAHLLDGGLSLGDVLGGLTTTQVNTLLNGVTGLLNGVLSQLTAPSAVQGVQGASCDVLHLALGPVDLNLLGLNVHLDDCAAGPATVDITAQPGAGNLLGNLLCGLAHLLDSNAAAPALLNKLSKIAGEIQALL